MKSLQTSTLGVISSTTSLTENLLKRKADKVRGEVMSRPGLGVTTVDSSGNLALSRPVNKHREALGEVTKGGIKRTADGSSTNSSGTKALKRYTKVELMLIVEAEKIVLPEKARLVKDDIIEAINNSRRSGLPPVHVAGLPAVHVVDDSDEEETMDVELETNDVELETNAVELQKRAMELEKTFIAVNSTKELIAIMAREKIVMGPGRKKKADYVDAIYSARHVNDA
jgi:hypothetical protein